MTKAELAAKLDRRGWILTFYRSQEMVEARKAVDASGNPPTFTAELRDAKAGPRHTVTANTPERLLEKVERRDAKIKRGVRS